MSNETLDVFLKSEVWGALKLIEYGGNLGDPIMHSHLGELIQTARKRRPDASHLIHTSGANRSLSWWEELFESLTDRDSITFSVDGLEDSNHIYRENAKWKTIEEAIKFCVGKVNTHWKMIVFKHNEHQIFEVAKRAKDLGVNWFMLTKSSRYNTGEDSLRPSPSWVFRPDREEKLEGLDPKCLKSSRHYLSADGKYFPCCWIAISDDPTLDCDIHSNFDFEVDLSQPMQRFTEAWQAGGHPTCNKICGKRKGLNSRTQYDQLEINLSQPFSSVEEKIRLFSDGVNSV